MNKLIIYIWMSQYGYPLKLNHKFLIKDHNISKILDAFMNDRLNYPNESIIEKLHDKDPCLGDILEDYSYHDLNGWTKLSSGYEKSYHLSIEE